MKLTATGNDVLTRLFSDDLNKWVRLRELLETFNKLWQIVGVLHINGNSDDWRHRVFHDLDVMSLFVGSDGTLLEKILVDSDETYGITAWNIWDSLDLTTHHDDGSLDSLDVQVGL